MQFKEYLHKIEEQFGSDVGLPVVRKESKIRILDERGLLSKVKTPVFIQLEDGTRLYMTRNEFERIKGERPALGKTLTVTFQRHSLDKSDKFSQVDTVYCH